MSEISSIIYYFDITGHSKTGQVLKVASKRAEEGKIKSIIISSRRGETGVKASELFKDRQPVLVPHVHGLERNDSSELVEDTRKAIPRSVGKILTATPPDGIVRAVRRKFDTLQCDELRAHTPRIFGKGLKLACEEASMAADEGLVSTQEDALSLGGVGGG